MRLVSFAFAGVEPELMGLGPVPATHKALEQRGPDARRDRPLRAERAVRGAGADAGATGSGSIPEDERLNPYGGAIACGHPLAATGVRLLAQLAYGFRERPSVRYGLTALCVGMGMGAALVWENVAAGTEFKLARVATRRSGRSRSSRSTTARTTRSRPSSGARRSSRSSALLAELEDGDWAALVADRQAVRLRGRRGHRRSSRGATRELAVEGSRAGHELFGRIRALPYPTVAAINGACLGGGVELALHCDARTISTAVRHFACPECFLGIVPALGRHAARPAAGRRARRR